MNKLQENWLFSSIPTLYATWINSPTENETSKLKEFLKIRLNLKKLDIINKEKN